LLLKTKTNIDYQDRNDCTPLHLLMKRTGKWKNPTILKNVLQFVITKENKSMVDWKKQTPLHVYLKNVRDIDYDIVSLLVCEENCDISDDNHDTPLHTAVLHK